MEKSLFGEICFDDLKSGVRESHNWGRSERVVLDIRPVIVEEYRIDKWSMRGADNTYGTPGISEYP